MHFLPVSKTGLAISLITPLWKDRGGGGFAGGCRAFLVMKTAVLSSTARSQSCHKE